MSLTRPPVPPASTLWGSLVQYYRSCLEREQSFAIRVPQDPASFVLLRDIDEHLITRKAITTILSEPVHTQPVLGYLNRRGKGIGGTFVYGYPLVRQEGSLVPLCYTEVRLEPGSAPNTVMLHRGNAELLVNRQFLRGEAGLSDPEVDDLLRSLRSPKSKGPVAVLDQFLLEVDLVYDAVLFGSEASQSARGPMRELQLMEQLRKDRLPDSIRIFVGEQGIGSAQPDPGLTIVQSDPSQDEVLLRRRAPFLVATGPAGAGKTQAAINLIASAMADGQRVLYVNPNPAAVDRAFGALTAGGLFPGVWRAGGREARLRSLAHARGVIASIREFQYQTEDPAVLARESQRLGQEAAQLDAEMQEVRRLDELIAELTILTSQVEESLRHHSLFPAMQGLADRITPENASLFSPSQLTGIRQLVCRLTGWAGEGSGSLSGRLRDMMRIGQIRSALKQLGLPEFCTPDGDLDALTDGLSRLEQAFPLLLSRARLLYARHQRARFRSLASIETALHDTQQAKISVDRKRLHGAWLQVADKVRPSCDEYEAIVGQEEQALTATTKARIQGRGQLAELLKAFPVTLSHTLLVAGSIPNEPELFDLLIIDDASTVDIPSALPVLYRAKRVCVLGDDHGLKHTTHLGDEEDSRLLGLVNGRNLAPFAYVEVSVLDRARAVVGQDQVLKLAREYRSAPPLLQFAAEQFYGPLQPVRQDQPDPGDRDLPATGFCFDNVPDGQTIIPAPEAISQAQNPLEAKRVARLVTQAIAQGMTDLAVVTPFRGQALLIAKLLSRLSEVESDPARAQLLREVDVATCQAIPAQPHRAVLLSMVAAQGAPPEMLFWLEKHRTMLNRAVQHATDLLIVIGHRSTLDAGETTLAAMVAHADRLASQSAPSLPSLPGLQPERFGLLHAERHLVPEILTLPDTLADSPGEGERDLHDRLAEQLRGRPVLLAPRLSLAQSLEPPVLADLAEELKAEAPRIRPLLTIIHARTLRPLAVVELDQGPENDQAMVDAICRQGKLPLVRIRPGQWQLLRSVVSLVPAP